MDFVIHAYTSTFRPDLTYETGTVRPYPSNRYTPGSMAQVVSRWFQEPLHHIGPLIDAFRMPGMAQTMSGAMSGGFSGPRLQFLEPDPTRGQFLKHAQGTYVVAQDSRGRLRLL